MFTDIAVLNTHWGWVACSLRRRCPFPQPAARWQNAPHSRVSPADGSGEGIRKPPFFQPTPLCTYTAPVKIKPSPDPGFGGRVIGTMKGANGRWGPWGPGEEAMDLVRACRKEMRAQPGPLRKKAEGGCEGRRNRGQEPGLGKPSPVCETRAAEPNGLSVTPRVLRAAAEPGVAAAGRAAEAPSRRRKSELLGSGRRRRDPPGRKAEAPGQRRREERGRPLAGAQRPPGPPRRFPTCSSPGGFQTIGNTHRRRRQPPSNRRWLSPHWPAPRPRVLIGRRAFRPLLRSPQPPFCR